MTRRGLTIASLAVMALCAALPAGPAAASWTTPADNISPDGQNPSAPRVAVGPDGAATAVWPASDGRIWASRRAPGGAWGPAEPLSPEGPSVVASFPDVAAGPGGAAVAVWNSEGDSGNQVSAVRYSGGQWGAPEPIDSLVNGTEPRVAIDAGGTATVVWRATVNVTPEREAVFASRSSGNAWSAPKLLSGDENTTGPRVAAGPAGEAIVVWQSLEGGILRVRAHRLEGGAWRDQIDEVSPDGQDAAEPAVVMDSRGIATVGWQWRATGGEYFAAAARLVGDSWNRSAELSEAGGDIDSLVVAAAPGGVAAVAWLREPESGPAVAEVTRFDGQSWQPGADVLSDPALSLQDKVGLAVGPDGVATVAWVLSGGPANLAQARRVGAAGPGPVHTLAPGLDSEDLGLAAGPDGVVTAVWRTYVDPEYVVRSARFRVPPPAPTGVRAVAGDAQATVSWTPPALTGGSPITGYLVTASPGGRTCSSSGALSCTVTALANGVAHTFTVRAINAQGTGPASAASAPVTPLAPAPLPVTPAPVPLPALAMTRVSLTPRVAVRGRPAQTTRTLTIRATLNRPARLRVLFERRLPGLRRGTRCVTPTAALRRAKARPCVRFAAAGSITRAGRTGANRITISRLKVGRRTLGVGRHRVSVIAATAGSRPVFVRRELLVRPAGRR